MKPTDFVIFKSHDDWVIKRVNAEYENHSHFRKKQACEVLQDLIVKGIMPDKLYFRVAAKRLLNDIEFAGLRSKQKTKYFNHCAKHYGRRTG